MDLTVALITRDSRTNAFQLFAHKYNWKFYINYVVKLLDIITTNITTSDKIYSKPIQSLQAQTVIQVKWTRLTTVILSHNSLAHSFPDWVQKPTAITFKRLTDWSNGCMYLHRSEGCTSHGCHTVTTLLCTHPLLRRRKHVCITLTAKWKSALYYKTYKNGRASYQDVDRSQICTPEWDYLFSFSQR